MAPSHGDRDQVLYQVTYEPRVPARVEPHSKARKLTLIPYGDVLVTHGGDETGNWRRVFIENDAGEEQEAWLQIHSEHLGQLLSRIGLDPTEDQIEMERVLPAATATTAAADDLLEDVVGEAVVPKSKRPGRFCNMLKNNGFGMNLDSSLMSLSDLTPRLSVGQLYKVVFQPVVAVRLQPEMTARVMRALKFETTVMCFEWDSNRQWRRVSIEWCGFDEDNDPTENPNWQPMVKSDGWVLILHPTKGALLEAVIQDEELNVAQEAAVQDRDAHPARELFCESSAVEDPRKSCTVRWIEDDEEDARTPVLAKGEPLLRQPTADDTRNLSSTAKPSAAMLSRVIDEVSSVEIFSERQRALHEEAERRRHELDRRGQEGQHLIDEVLNSVSSRALLDEPPIMCAARAGSLKVVDLLLRRFADPNQTDAMGETALFEAGTGAHTDIVGHLLLCHADVEYKTGDGIDAEALTDDGPTLALMRRWRGAVVDEDLLKQALHRLTDNDRKRMMKVFDMPEPAQAVTQPTAQPHHSAVLATAVSSVAPAKPSPVLPHSSEGAPGAPTLEECQMDAHGTPKRIEMPTLHRVIYKKVAVRRFPNMLAPTELHKKIGEEVEMFEWDCTRFWRRVRTQVQDEDGSKEVDGWMLTYTEKLGPLVVPVAGSGEDETAG